MQKEIWKDIPGYEGSYQISTFGRVKSLKRNITRIRNGKKHIYQVQERILRPCIDKHGYLQFNIKLGGAGKSYKIHTMMAKVFLGRDIDGSYELVVDHIDENKQNNNLNNLQLLSNRDNVLKSCNNKYPGTAKAFNKFFARIRYKNKRIHLGMFDTQQEAHEAYLEAKRKIENNEFEIVKS